MKIVVANAHGVLSDGRTLCLFPSRWDSAWHGARGLQYYPYELAYLSSLLKRECPGDDVLFVDGNARNMSAHGYASVLCLENPDIFVTECSALTVNEMTYVADRLKRECNTRTILTGPVATHYIGNVTIPQWDYMVAGEYERKVVSIIRNEPITDTPIDLDWLPWPEDEDVARIDYWECATPHKNMIQLYPTRGCPISCTFCVAPLYYGGHGNNSKSHRCREITDVCNEIEYLAEKYGDRFSGCFFNDEAHNANVDWLLKFNELLKLRHLDRYAYDAMCGYWTMTEKVIASMRAAGYVQVRLGVESLSSEVGKQTHKRTHEIRMQEVLGWCRDCGMRIHLTLQVGQQGSTRETDMYTIDTVKNWKCQGLVTSTQCSISTPQPGTPFYKEVKRNRWFVREDWRYLDGIHPVVSYPHYSADEIAEMAAQGRKI